MDRVQFGTYQFPHNPKVIRIVENRRAVVQPLPFLGELARPLSRGITEVTLEGELFSQSVNQSLAEFERLRQIYERGREELLFLPGRQPFFALFDHLELIAEGDGRILRYQARFLQARSWEGNE